MLKKFELIFILSLVLCNSVVYAQNALVPQEMRVESFVRLQKMDSIFQNPYKTYEYNEVQNVHEQLYQALTSPQIKLYETSYNKRYGIYSSNVDTVTLDNRKSKLGLAPLYFQEYDKKGKPSKITKLIPQVNPNDIQFIVGFEESWNFDVSTLRFDKKVHTISISRQFVDETKQLQTKMVGSIVNNLTPGIELQLVANVSYEHSMVIPQDVMYNDCNESFTLPLKNAGVSIQNNSNCSMFTEYARKQLFELLCESSLEGTLQAVDFFTKEKLDSISIAKRLGAGVDKLTTIDEKGNEKDMLIPIAPNYDNFQAIIFVEDWYFNHLTFSLIKVVKEIALVQYSYSDYDTQFKNPIRTIAFSVICNN